MEIGGWIGSVTGVVSLILHYHRYRQDADAREPAISVIPKYNKSLHGVTLALEMFIANRSPDPMHIEAIEIANPKGVAFDLSARGMGREKLTSKVEVDKHLVPVTSERWLDVYKVDGMPQAGGDLDLVFILTNANKLASARKPRRHKVRVHVGPNPGPAIKS